MALLIIEIVLVSAALLFAGLVKGVTGMGFASFALALATFVVGHRMALALSIIPSFASSLFLMATTPHLAEMSRRFWPMYAAILPGIAAGLWLLVRIDGHLAASVLGGVVVVYALFALSRPVLRLSRAWSDRLRAPIGVAHGLVNGLTGSQLIPSLPYLLACDLDPARFVQTANILLTVSSLLMLAGLTQIGALTPAVALAGVAACAPTFAGVVAGSRIRDRLPVDTFRKIVLVLLVVLGGLLIARGLR